MGAAILVEAHPHLASLAEQAVEGAQRAEMAAPTVLQDQQIEQENRQQRGESPARTRR
jgi:hypothetical protein